MGGTLSCCATVGKQPGGIINSESAGGKRPECPAAAKAGANGSVSPRIAVADRRKSVLPQGQFARQMVHDIASREAAVSSTASPSKAASTVGRRTSQLNFAERDQTVIIFDWDDTLFPTTWVRDDMELPWNQPCPQKPELVEPLKKCALRALEMLRSAKVFSERVVIVTLAASPWVETSIECFFRELLDPLKEMNIPIIYARDLVKDSAGDYNKNAFQSNEEIMAYWTDVKAKAIGIQCEEFYSKYEGQSWKNVISIGDSDFEREGTKNVTKAWTLANKRNATQLPRTKTVKMLDDPTIDELSDQLKLINSWLPALVEKDQGFSLDLELAGSEHFDNVEKLLKDSGSMAAEPPDTAILEGQMWKLNSNGNPMNEDDWLPRRMWLSATGRLWYESLKAVEPIMFFAGLCVGQLTITELEAGVGATAAIKGQPCFAIRFDGAGNLEPRILAADSAAHRQEWIRCFSTFRGTAPTTAASMTVSPPTTAEKVRASHILLKHTGSRNPRSRRTNLDVTCSKQEAETDLRELAKRVTRENFGQFALERSDCGSYKEMGDLDWFGPGEMQAPFEDATRRLQIGQISDIVATESGLHLILRTG